MGTLYVIATPIGNLEDVTLRALRLLGECELLYAEDTRRTRVLLDAHGVQARPVSLNAHNEARRIEQALDLLASGADVALVSDAGTPLVSDPGERLVQAAVEAGHRVDAIPGASAVLGALVVSGLPAAPFVFVGFPPRKAGARRALFASYRGRPETLVLFESPRRVAATLTELAAVLGERRACVARELTKLHEEVVRDSLPALATHFAGEQRGEFSIVVAGCAPDEVEVATAAPALDDAGVDEEIRHRIAAGGRPRQIAAELARRTGLPRRELYARVLSAHDAARDARREES